LSHPSPPDAVSEKRPDANLLCLDIEWRPALVYRWDPYHDTATPDKVVENDGMLCVGLKWLGDEEVLVLSEWEHGHENMVNWLLDIMDAADAIITFNGDKYDLRKIDGEAARYAPGRVVKPVPSIDLYKTTKRLGYFIGKLNFVCRLLGIGEKLEHEGMALWTKVVDGDKDAQRRMGEYCAQDVRLLEPLYYRVRPFIRNHPYLGETAANQCPSCGATDSFQKRGWRPTRYYKVQRLVCTECGSWTSGERKKNAVHHS
jgi:hypothetical protein